MASELWISIPNWEKFQHYKDRNAPWIKTYTELLNRDDYRELTHHQRGILHGLWIVYATTNRHARDSSATDTRQLSDRHATDKRWIRGSTLALSRRLGHRVVTADLEALNHAGFIDLVASTHKQERASTALASRAPAHSQEAETETKEPTSPQPEASYAPNGDEARWGIEDLNIDNILKEIP